MSIRKIFSILGSFVNVILFILLACMIFLVISSKASGGEPNVLGYQIKSVLSGSMEPTFQTGSVIAIDPNIDNKNLQKGDIITFMKDEQNLVTHRIIDVKGSGENISYITKGDNNEDPDGESVIAENVIGVYNGVTIPYLGYMMNFANSQKGSILLLIVPGLLLLLYSAFSIWRTIAEIDRKNKAEEVKAQ